MQQRDNVKHDIESERRFNNSSYTTRLDLFQTLRISHQCIRFLFLFLFVRISFDFYLIWISAIFLFEFFFVNEYFFCSFQYTHHSCGIWCESFVWIVCSEMFATIKFKSLLLRYRHWTLIKKCERSLFSHCLRIQHEQIYIYICTNEGCITYSTDFSPINNRNSCLIRRFYTIYFVLTANWLVCLFCNARDENPLLECIS